MRRSQTIDLTRPYIEAACHRTTGATTAASCVGSSSITSTPTSSRTTTSTGSVGDRLARAYDLIVFSGSRGIRHGTRVRHSSQRYRDLGGNLAFLSANDFFYKVEKRGDTMDGRWRWRDLGRPEAALVGAQYVDWNHGRYPNRPFTVVGVKQDEPWLFRNTGLADGAQFGVYGIEVDATAAELARGTQRSGARSRTSSAPARAAEMTYYTTPAGAKVFSAGVMNFGGSALWPVVSVMMQNIWTELSRP